MKSVDFGSAKSMNYANTLLNYGANCKLTYSAQKAPAGHQYYNSKPMQGDTCLHMLFRQIYKPPELTSIAERIITSHPELLNIRNSAGETPFWIALQRNLDKDLVRICFHKGGSLLKARISFRQRPYLAV